MRIHSLASAAALAALLAPLPPAMAQEIGVAASVREQVRGTLTGDPRDLASGDGVSRDEVIETGDDSAAQLLFEDRTTVTLGENARLTLNRFVYDPGTGAGTIAVRATKGAFRFVSGLAKSGGGYSVETPRLTIGIRGSIIEGFIDERTGREIIVLVQGTIRLCDTSGECVEANEPGTFVQILPSGRIVGPVTWTGPIMNLNAGVDFVKAAIEETLDAGDDPLPRTDTTNEVLDMRSIDPRDLDEPEVEPEPEPGFEEEP